MSWWTADRAPKEHHCRDLRSGHHAWSPNEGKGSRHTRGRLDGGAVRDGDPNALWKALSGAEGISTPFALGPLGHHSRSGVAGSGGPGFCRNPTPTRYSEEITLTTPRPEMSTTAIWETITTAPGVRQTREAYRADVRRVRTAPSSAGTAYRVDNLATRLAHDPAWEAKRNGSEQEAFDRLIDDLPYLRADLRARRLAGVHLRRLVLAPTIPTPYSAFAFEAAQFLADLGEAVRIIVDDRLRARVAEVTVYGSTTWRLCTNPNQFADGAVRLEPVITPQVRSGLGGLWDEAQDIRDFVPC